MVEKKDVQPTKDVISDTQPVGGTFMTLPLASATTPIQVCLFVCLFGRLLFVCFNGHCWCRLEYNRRLSTK